MNQGTKELRLDAIDLPLGNKFQGKVRDIWEIDDTRRVIVTTDRQSAFDVVLGTIPFKGQVLNAMAAWWFERTRDIVPNHLLAVPDPNVMLVRSARVWPVEMVIRGYITGVTKTALWYNYAQGQREIYGLRFPDGLRKNERLPEAVNADRFEAEILLLADKSDVTEELVRLRAHLAAFGELCRAEDESAAGKKLEFLVQEILREINTIGSKSRSTELASSVVDMKHALENIREQLANVQ